MQPAQELMPVTDEMATVADVARVMKLKPAAVRRLVENEGLPVCKINSRVWRFEMGEVRAWAAKRRAN